jgi:hypothetical protein
MWLATLLKVVQVAFARPEQKPRRPAEIFEASDRVPIFKIAEQGA